MLALERHALDSTNAILSSRARHTISMCVSLDNLHTVDILSKESFSFTKKKKIAQKIHQL